MTPLSLDTRVSIEAQSTDRARAVSKGGRPPRTEAAIVLALKAHPELRGRPGELARFIALSDPTLSGLSSAAITSAILRLKRRFGGKLVVESLCADEDHVGSIVETLDGERTCGTCGRSFGFGRDGSTFSDQRAFVNRLNVVYEPQGLVYPRRDLGMISQAATNQAAYGGDDVQARLKRKALSALAQLCKDVDKTLLPHSRTDELARLVEGECDLRGSYTKTASLEEAKNSVISALISLATSDKGRAPVYLGMVKAATVLFIDSTRSVKKSPNHSHLDEEEAVSKTMSKEDAFLEGESQ